MLTNNQSSLVKRENHCYYHDLFEQLYLFKQVIPCEHKKNNLFEGRPRLGCNILLLQYIAISRSKSKVIAKKFSERTKLIFNNILEIVKAYSWNVFLLVQNLLAWISTEPYSSNTKRAQIRCLWQRFLYLSKINSLAIEFMPKYARTKLSGTCNFLWRWLSYNRKK